MSQDKAHHRRPAGGLGGLSALIAKIAAFVALAAAGAAQEAYYFSLPREGTASVLIDAGSHRAIIVDGGRKNSLDAPLLNGKDLVSALLDQGVRDLVVACSHPHDDHQGGLKTLIGKQGAPNRRLLEFGSITFVDSGYRESDALFEHYRSSFGEDFDPGRVSRKSAKNNDALGALWPGEDGATGIRNFVYDPGGDPRAHGNSIVTMAELAADGGKKRIVDFDDANDEVVRKWVEWAKSDPAARRPDVMVLPHHGTDTSDVGLLLDEEIRPKRVIITANPNNRFGHPGSKTLGKLASSIGLERVHVTASGTVRVTSEGVRDGFDDAGRKKALLERVIEPRMRLAELEKAKLEEQVAEFAGKPNLKERHDVLAEELGRLASLRAECAGSRPSKAGGAVAGLPDHRPPSAVGAGGGLPGADAFGELRKKVPTAEAPNSALLKKPNAKPGRLIERASRFKMSIRGRPVFGGLILGNEVAVVGGSITAASLAKDSDDWHVSITVTGSDGTRATGVYRNFTAGELWSALQFVQPAEDLRNRYGAQAGECNLVGMTKNMGTYWSFAVHPAIAGTILARDGMRLDMFIAVSSPPELRGVKYGTYQWYDVKSEIEVVDGEVSVSRQGDRSASVMGLRLWKYPDWVKSEATLNQEFLRRMSKLPANLSEKERELWREVVVRSLDSDSEGTPVEFETRPLIQRVFGEFDGLRRIDRFARLVALLNAIHDADVTLAMPDSLPRPVVGFGATYFTYEVLSPGTKRK